MPRPKVSEKNTKQELLAAYHELLTDAGEKPARLPERDPALVNVDELGQTALRPLAELKLTLSQQLDRIGSEFLRGIEAVREVQQSAARERSRLAERHAEQQTILDREVISVRQAWQREQATKAAEIKEYDRQRELDRTREEEAYRYEQTIQRRNQTDEFERDKAARERTLIEREQALKDRQQAIQTMEKELAAVPAKIETAVKEVELALTARLTEQHERAVRELTLAAEHAQVLATTTIANLAATVKERMTEIDQLKTQLSAAHEQIKQMAVTAIEARKPSNPTPTDRA